jgi:hypothetical protein
MNKVTKLFPEAGATLNEEAIQAHLDAQNGDGWQLVCLDNMTGWYRFFWFKQEV